MKRDWVELAVADSRSMMEAYWQGDPEYCISRLDDPFDWTGSAAHEHFHGGRDEWAALLRGYTAQNPKVFLTEAVYYPVAVFQDGCAVFGTYIGQTDPASGYLLRERQRVTFTWKRRADRLLLTSLHISNPMETVQPGESFPFTISQSSWEYVRHQMGLGAARDVRPLVLKAVGGSLHALALGDVVYLEARGRYTFVHSIEDAFPVRAGLSELETELDGHFLRVGRSFCVNLSHVKSFDRAQITLFGGDVIPVPARHAAELREEFLRRMK
ncbi:MAG: LytTR family DNA-binding domain-containing protein [Eubacteriales bacterium]|nr:LytTR family DNA-binding domain-containing protein [Eubacteriales bacterium]